VQVFSIWPKSSQCAKKWVIFFKSYSEKPVGFDVLQGGTDVGVCYENHVEQVFL